MKKYGAIQVAFTYIGSILGAGFVSGQELWLYFGCYGQKGLAGLFFSLLLLAASAFLVLRIVSVTGDPGIDSVLYSSKCPTALREVTGILFVLFYFFITTVMLAGVASLGEALDLLPGPACGGICCLLIMIIAYFGISGMTGVFSIFIPALTAAAIVISLLRIGSAGTGALVFRNTATNPLLGGWLTSALNYAACNSLTSVGVIAPLTPLLKNKKTVPAGILLGGTALMMIAYAIVLALTASPDCVEKDLPMMALAISMGSVFSAVYGALLFLGMLSAGISCMVAVSEYLKLKLPVVRKHPAVFVAVLGILSYLMSLFGFSDLVGVVYPFMGYAGILSMLLLIYRALRLTRAAAP